MVSLTELLPGIRQLSFLEKNQLLRILTKEVEPLKVPEHAYFEPYKIYYFHTPYHTFGAAEQIMQFLKENTPIN